MKWIDKFKLARVLKKYRKKVNANEAAYLTSAIKAGQTVFDIGAHMGAYTYFLQQAVGKTGFVHAFEPQAKLYSQLLINKELLQWHNITINHLALSDSKGSATLNVPSYKGKADTEGASLLIHSDRSLYTTENVATESLDNYCKPKSLAPAFLKIDVEGNELKVLQGGIETIKNFSPKILIEIEARHSSEEQANAAFKILTDLGYQGSFTFDGRKTPLSLFRFDVHQADKLNCNNFIFEKNNVI
ncbi:MAG TPA: FkbM family methyltransferase [Segetibacter sp.]|nr:FkbM family methyltransferase [Segetibacter sp.]